MFEEKNLYRNYTAKGSTHKDIRDRHDQRVRWLNKYKENGSCKQLLIDAGVIIDDNEVIE